MFGHLITKKPLKHVRNTNSLHIQKYCTHLKHSRQFPKAGSFRVGQHIHSEYLHTHTQTHIERDRERDTERDRDRESLHQHVSRCPISSYASNLYFPNVPPKKTTRYLSFQYKRSTRMIPYSRDPFCRAGISMHNSHSQD